MILDSGFVMAAARIAPVAALTPALGERSIWARAVVAALLIALIGPSLHSVETAGLPIFRELLIGGALGVAASLPFWAARSAGVVLGGGLRLGTGALESAYLLLALALFAVIDGPRLTVVGIAQSYSALPAGTSIMSDNVVALLFRGGEKLFLSAAALSAPALAALLLVDLFRALIERAQPTFERAVGTSGLRLLIGLCALALGVRAFVPAITSTGFLDPKSSVLNAIGTAGHQ